MLEQKHCKFSKQSHSESPICASCDSEQVDLSEQFSIAAAIGDKLVAAKFFLCHKCNSDPDPESICKRIVLDFANRAVNTLGGAK